MTTAPSVPTMLHLRLGGTSVVARLDDAALPCVLHWGPDLGDVSTQALDELQIALTPPYVDSAISSQAAVALLPQHSSGWLGRPGLLGSRAGGRSWSVSFDRVEHRVETAGSADWADGAAGAVRLRSVGLTGPAPSKSRPRLRCTPADWSGSVPRCATSAPTTTRSPTCCPLCRCRRRRVSCST